MYKKRYHAGIPWLYHVSIAYFVLIFAPLSFAQAPSSNPDTEPLEPAIIEVREAAETPAPVAIDELSESRSGILEEIRSLEQALEQRESALIKSRERLAFAENRQNRLAAEYESLQQRLETAGLGLTREYAHLLRQRLDRLERQHLADDLATAIKAQLEAARMEQFRLEEFDALQQPSVQSSDRLAQRRAALLEQLGTAVTAHLESLGSYFLSVNATQALIIDYQSLVRQRLFWLPSTDPISVQSFSELATAAVWLMHPGRWYELLHSIPSALRSRPAAVVLLTLLLTGLVFTRRRVRRALEMTSTYIGNVGRDRSRHTFLALWYSVTLALAGTVALLLAASLVVRGGEFGAALSTGLENAAFLFFLLSMVYQIARKNGLGARHFKWRAETLHAVRRGIPRLAAVMIPAAIVTSVTEAAIGEQFQGSLGRVAFALASIELALFADRVLKANLARDANGNATVVSRSIYLVVIATPLALMGLSLYGYHYTAVQLEGTLFITACWVSLVALFYYLALRALSVRERRMTLDHLLEKRAAEQELAAAREAADASGGELPTVLEMPEMDLNAISAQSKTLLRILAGALTAMGFWLLWANVFPAFRVLDEITLWTVAPLTDGGTLLMVTLEDLVVSALIAAATVLAVRNLPGTLEVTVLSQLNLAPGSGYAITTLITYTVVIIGVVVTFSMLGAQWSRLQWLIAALGVGLGFGLQEIVANFVSGIVILFERPIRVGDTITVGGKTGTVARIRIRATTLIDWDRKEQVIPNKTFVTQDFTNWTLSDPITRVIIRVGVAYGSDIDLVQRILSSVATNNKRVVKDPPPTVFCVALAESSVNFEMRVFVKSMQDIMPLSHELHAAIVDTLREAGISIPFPQRDIHIC